MKKASGIVLAVVLVISLSFTVFAADFDWMQRAGDQVSLILVRHPFTESMLPLIPEFEEATGIRVIYEILSEEEFRDKLLIDLSTGSGTYDLFMTGPVTTWQYLYSGWVEPLDDYLDDPSLTSADYDLDDFIPSLIASSRWDGNPGSPIGTGPLWAIPLQEEAYNMVYRTDLLEGAGVSVPQTWDELYEAAVKLTGEVDGQMMYGVGARGHRSWPTVHTAYGTVFFSYGGQDLDENFQCIINSPEGVAATELWAKTLREAGPDGITSYTWYEAKEGFAAGRYAFYIDADHQAIAFEDETRSMIAGKIDYALPPAGPPGTPASNIWLWSMSMASSSRSKEAAWLFLQWATSKEVMRDSALQGNMNPVRTSVWEDPAIDELIGGWGAYKQVVMDLINNYARLYWTPNPELPAMGDRWAQAFQEVLLEEKTAQEALDDAVVDINNILRRAGLQN